QRLWPPHGVDGRLRTCVTPKDRPQLLAPATEDLLHEGREGCPRLHRARPETLHPEEWIRLYEALGARTPSA
ncbi:MAG: hypothetical protein ACKOHI_02505, partial [Phycisphaerales bacterium]